jgi:trimethylamine:corrinoid methyltransferase-like protein
LLIASARPSVLGGLGSLGNCTVTSYESILIDDERYAMIFRAMQGASVEGDRLDLGVFEEIARSGNALWSAQTMKYMRSDEIVNYRFAVREGLVNGGLVEDSLVERARKKTRKLLETYEVEPLDEEIASHINQIICEYDHQFINRSSSTEDL